MTTPFHAKYWAHSLLLAHPRDGVEALSRSIENARVDLNPHQIDDALFFAHRSPYSKGVPLADEVGLGKTIEASLVLTEKFAGHSLRASFATTAAKRGRSLDAIRRQTRPRSERVARMYIRHAKLFDDNTAGGPF